MTGCVAYRLASNLRGEDVTGGETGVDGGAVCEPQTAA
jgi:hypothetical protein